MNERALRPANVAAGAVLIGGALMVVLPRHALTIVQLVIVAGAASAALYVLATSVPATGWLSPFRWLSPFGDPGRPTRAAHRSRVLDMIRDRLADRRQRVVNGPPMPPAVLRRLKALTAATLDLDLRDEARLASARGRVSPLMYAILTSEPLERSTWLRTNRPDAHEVAEIVHRVLDELQRLASGSAGPSIPDDHRL